MLAQPVQSGEVDGIRVVRGSPYLKPAVINGHNTVQYLCDLDPVSGLPNFQISGDTCTGRVLAPLESCNLGISYVPQPATSTDAGLDYYLQLNTQQCTGAANDSYCETDSGRFPVRLRVNPSSARSQ